MYEVLVEYRHVAAREEEHHCIAQVKPQMFQFYLKVHTPPKKILRDADKVRRWQLRARKVTIDLDARIDLANEGNDLVELRASRTSLE